MRLPSPVFFVALACNSIAPAYSAVLPPLTSENTGAVHQLLKPTPDEMDWLEIPWKTDLMAARKAAAAEGKPVYLWEMDGNPLGCT